MILNDIAHPFSVPQCSSILRIYYHKTKKAASAGSFTDFPHVFIRAPYITTADPEVEILSVIDGNIVGVRYQNQIGLAFHPEMTTDDRIHKMFLELIDKAHCA